MFQWMNDAASVLSTALGIASLRLIPITVFGLVAACLARRASASARHQVWLTVVIAAVALPVVSAFIPTLAVLPGLDETDGVLPRRQVDNGAFAEALPGAVSPVPARDAADTPVAPESVRGELHRGAFETRPDVVAAPPDSEGLTSATLPVVVWVIGVMTLVLLALRGQYRLARRRANATVADAAIEESHQRIRSQLGIRREVMLRISGDELMPMTWGVFRPVVLLPASSASWTADRLRMVLLHELAHVKRLDGLTQWITTLATAIYWFHPAMWFAVRRLCTEREQACDDAVVNAGHTGSDYAAQLLDISTGCRRDVLAMCAGMAMSRSARLQGRVQAILDPNIRRSPVSWYASVVTSLAAMLVVGLVATVGPAAAQQRVVEDAPGVSNPGTESEPGPDIQVVEESPESGIMGIRLPGGTRIDVLGIGDDPADADNVRWWRVDGTIVDGPVFRGFDGIRNPRTGRFVFKQYAVRVTGRDPRAAQRTRLFSVAEGDAGGIRWRSEFQRDTHIKDGASHGFLAAYATTQDTTTLSLAVARHDSVRKWSITHLSRKTASTVVQPEPVERTVISGPVGGDADALVLPVAHNFTQHDVRIYAVLPNNKRIEADRVDDTGTDAFRHATARFSGLKLEDVRNFELDIRPLIRFEIRNVSMRPGALTRPQLFGPWTPANGEGPAEGGMRYVDPAKQKALEQRVLASRASRTQQRLETILKNAPDDLTAEQRSAIELIARHESNVRFDDDGDGSAVRHIELTMARGDDDQAIRSLAAFGDIEHIQIGGDGLTDLHFAGFAQLRSLKGLTVFDAPNVTGFVSRSLHQLDNLEYLRLTSEEFDDTDLKQLADLKSVKFLELDGTSVTDAGLQHLGGFPALQHVDLSGTDLTGAGLEILRDLPSLTHLMLDDTELTDGAIRELASLPHLKALHIQGTTEVTAEAVVQLRSSANLEGLGLNDWHLSDEVLDMIVSKPGLKYLWLDGGGITDETLAKLRTLNLADLVINGPRITDEGVRHLAGMSNLKRLALNNCRIGDNALQSLHGLENLELLDIADTDATDAGLSHLTGLNNLEYINAMRTSVTEHGVASLKSKLPRVAVSYDRSRR